MLSNSRNRIHVPNSIPIDMVAKALADLPVHTVILHQLMDQLKLLSIEVAMTILKNS